MLGSGRKRRCRWLSNECWNQPSEFRRSGKPSAGWQFEIKVVVWIDESKCTEPEELVNSLFLSCCFSRLLDAKLILFLFFTGVSPELLELSCGIKICRLNFVDSNYASYLQYTMQVSLFALTWYDNRVLREARTFANSTVGAEDLNTLLVQVFIKNFFEWSYTVQ